MKQLIEYLFVWTQLIHFTISFNCERCRDANVCDTITGNFRVTVMGKGYHPVVTVPRGACNINVTELGNTDNVLALKDVNREKYILNGLWLMDPAGDYSAVGAMFSYMKDEQSCPGECINAVGPILGPVTVQLLYHERNPGVTFRYQLPKHVKDLPSYNAVTDTERGELRKTASTYKDIPEEREKKRIGTFPKFVPLPGPSGIHHRGPIFSSDFKYRRQNSRTRKNFPRGDRRSLTDVTYSRGLDDDSARLEESNEIDHSPDITSEAKANSIEALEGSGYEVPYVGNFFAWTLSYHTNCTRYCGGGITMEVYQCSSISNGTAVDDVHCNALQKPEIHHKVCNSEPCTQQWKAGEWSKCSVSCGQGVQSRVVKCHQRISAIDAQELEDSYCGSSKPVNRKLCYAESCYTWYLGDWSDCSVQCGSGHRSRTVQCQDRSGNDANETLCSDPIPPSEKQCVAHHNSCSSGWYYTQWYGKCSADCGNGIMTRRVQCATEDGQMLHNDQCDSTRMPSTEKLCRTDTKCGGRWFTGPWSECSQACGIGKMTRRVVCIKYEGDNLTIIDDSACHGDEKPRREKECTAKDCGNAWFRTEWSKCSKSCNGGIRTRSVRCMTDTFQPSSDCDALERPEELQICNTDKCRKPKSNRRARCSDRYPNCNVVVQAKLCRYPYYQRKCCKSCSGLKRLY